MRHEEENHWHPADRYSSHDRRRASQHHREGKNINDFGSRWGEPDPRFNPQQPEWRQLEDENRRERRHPREDWRPFDRHIEEQQRRHSTHRREEQEYREPVWRQRDRHFNSSNQHANDRWQNDETMPDSNRNRSYEEERRYGRHRDYRED